MAELPDLSGTVLRGVPAADPRLIHAGDAQLAEARSRLFRSLVKESSELRKPLAQAAESMNALVAEAPLAADGTRLLASGTRAVESVAKSSLEGAFRQIESEIHTGVDRAISRGSRAQAAHLQKLGLRPLSAEMKHAIHDSTMRALDEEFPPGSGLTMKDRLARIESAHAGQMSKVLRRPHAEDAVGRVQRDVSTGLTHSKPGRTPIAGGSAMKKVQRVLVSEETRLANRVEVETIRASNVVYAHWRLSPDHRWYGGREVCEHLASDVDEHIQAELDRIGVQVDPAVVQGLYRVDSWPAYPHPYCKCYPEAWYPADYAAALENSSIVAVQAGAFPEELIASGAVTSAEISAGTATLTAVAEEMGVATEFSAIHVETMGTKGMAQALAQRIRSLPGKREQALASVRKTLADRIPKVEAEMDKTIARFRREVQAITNDQALAESTRASLIARTQVEIQREVIQNSANVEALLAMEQELAAKHLSPLITSAATSQQGLVTRLSKMGLRGSDYTVQTRSGQFWAEINPKSRSRLVQNVTQTTPARRAKILDIKAQKHTFDMKGSRKVLEEFTEGHQFRQFTLDKGQQAGALLAEQEKQVLLHFAPGIGKTPMATASVNSLHAKGLVKRALISPPAAVRDQFLREIMKFSDDSATSTMFVPKSEMAKTARSIRSSIENELRGNKGLSASDVQRIADSRMSRITLKPVPRGPNAAAEFEALMEGDKSRFLVMGHDDMAAFARQLPKHVDAAYIDEVHQLTAANAGPGSFKAEALQQLTGGRLKYKVGLTGTSVRNTVGELWDTANWLKPGLLPSKKEFLAVYDGLTLESNMLQNSMVKALRARIDDFVYTLPSPVEAELTNFLNDPSKLRRLQLSTVQASRAGKIESQFQKFKQRQQSMEVVEKRALETQLNDDKAALTKKLRSRGISDPESGAILELSAGEQAEIRRLKSVIEDSNKVLHPESWRDNQHFLNIHDLDGKTNAKVQELKRLLSNELQGEKTIVHLEQMASIESIQGELAATGKKVAVYSGDMSMSSRAQLIDKFNAGEIDTLLVTRAGSTGLNLQKASAATVHFDTPFTHAEYLQREARNWRRGQNRAVRSYLLHQEDHFLDRRRLDILRRKKKVLDAVDEASKLDDVVEHRVLLRATSRQDMMSYEELVNTRGKSAANAFLEKMCSELALGPDETCPFRPVTLAQRANRAKPVLQAGTQAQQEQIVERNPGRRPSTPD